MKTKHTPGPWTALMPDDPKAPDLVSIKGGDGNGVALTSSQNARLIASAPEMIEALELVQNYIIIAGDPKSLKLYEHVIQLIAKARGEK
jgi:hypothetical protein